MSEIEKMYENAGIKPDCTYLFLVDGNGENEAARTISIGSKADLKRLIVDCGVKGRVIKSTNTLKPFYPPFTAEKQIEIEHVILQNKKNYNKWIEYNINVYGEWVIRFVRTDKFAPYIAIGKTRAETFAKLISAYWQSLTEEQKQQVKGILE